MLTIPSLTVIAALVTPLDFVSHLDGVRAAWRIEDPLERCLALPEIPGTSWPQGVWESYCRFRHAHSRVATLSEINRNLDAGDAEGLNALFTRYLEQHYSDPDERDILHFAMDRFGSAEGLEAAQRWHYLDPESAFSNAALARALARASHRARGTALASATTADQFDAMRELAAVAVPYALTALDIEPRMYSACIDLIHVGRIDSQFLVELAGIESCRGADPSSLMLYDQWILSAQPKWGGSVEDMTLVKFEASQFLELNPLLNVAVLSAEGDLIAEHIPGRSGSVPSEMAELIDEEVRQAPEMLRLLAQGRIRGSDNDSLEAIAFTAAYIALRPDWNGPYAHYLLGFHLYNQGDPRWAADELTRAIELGWTDQSYGTRVRIARSLMALEEYEEVLPWMRQLADADTDLTLPALVMVSEDYIRNRNHEAAAPYVERLIRDYPEVAAGWFFRYSMMFRTGSRDELLELARQVREHANDGHGWNFLLESMDRLEADLEYWVEEEPPIP